MRRRERKKISNTDILGTNVYVSYQFTRDNISDLSVPPMNRTGIGSRDLEGPTIFERLDSSWHQAYMLAESPPVNVSNANIMKDTHTFATPESLKSITESRQQERASHSQIPIFILLMDPSTYCYELLRLYTDLNTDTARDLVIMLQESVPAAKWNRRYDGILQNRENEFTQLINILRLNKYDILPDEILIAKPHAVSSKETIHLASSLVLHLKNIGVISTNGKSVQKNYSRKSDSTGPSIMSAYALDRIFTGNGFLRHSQAAYFVAFSPPFEDCNTILYKKSIQSRKNKYPGFQQQADLTNMKKSTPTKLSIDMEDERNIQKIRQQRASQREETKSPSRGTDMEVVGQLNPFSAVFSMLGLGGCEYQAEEEASDYYCPTIERRSHLRTIGE